MSRQKAVLFFSLLLIVLGWMFYWKKSEYKTAKESERIVYHARQKNDIKKTAFYKKDIAESPYVKYYFICNFRQEVLAEYDKRDNRDKPYCENRRLPNEIYFKNDRKPDLEKTSGGNVNWIAEIGSANDPQEGNFQVYKDLMRMLILRFSDKTMDDFHKNAKVSLGYSCSI